MGALSKLDEFILNLQFRTCSVAVPGTSRNSDSENREPTGDHSLNDPCPEAVFSPHRSGNLNGSELEESHHIIQSLKLKWALISRRKKTVYFPNLQKLQDSKMPVKRSAAVAQYLSEMVEVADVFSTFFGKNDLQTDGKCVSYSNTDGIL